MRRCCTSHGRLLQHCCGTPKTALTAACPLWWTGWLPKLRVGQSVAIRFEEALATMGCRCGNSLSVTVTVTVSLNSVHNVVWGRLTNAAFCARNDDTTVSEKFGLLLFSRIETHAAHHDSLCTAVPDDGGSCTSHANQQVLNAYCSNYALQRFVLPAEQLRAYTFKLILLCMQGGTRAASSDCHSSLPLQVDSRYCTGLCLTMCDRHDATEPDTPSCHVVLIGS